MLRIAISACLLGDSVRWNGGHKRDATILEMIGPYTEWVPVCPEEAIGLGTPRDPVRLERDGDKVEMLQPATGRKLGDAMQDFSKQWRDNLGHVDGVILKRGSPSCGIGPIKVFADGKQAGNSPGLFAKVLLQNDLLPITDEGRMREGSLRDAFLDRVWGRRRWYELEKSGLSAGKIQAFHAREKYSLLCRNQEAARRLGQLAAEGDPAYGPEFARTMALVPKVGGHVNVLEHMLGFVKNELLPIEKTQALRALHGYRRGLLNRDVVLSLVRFLLVTRHAPSWVREQTYLDRTAGQLDDALAHDGV